MNDAGGLDQPMVYQITVKGTLDESWSDWFEGLALVPLATGDTLLTGPVADQAALYGILWKLRDLNLVLVSVARIERDVAETRPLMKGEMQMAGLTRTIEERLSTRTALMISIAVILARWTAKAIYNLLYTEAQLARIRSMQGLARSALTGGVLVAASVTLLLYLSRERYGDLGFHGRRLPRQIGLGVLFGALIFCLDTFLIGPVAEALLPEAAPSGVDMSVYFRKWSYLPIWLAIVLLKGGFAEELWRIFGLTRFEKRFGRAGLMVALLLGSLVFGLGHTYQGLGAVITNVLQGLLFAGVYLRKRSAWEPVVAHAVFDLISITLGFLMYA